MKKPIHPLAILVFGLLMGCGPSGPAAGIEGTYVDADSPDVSLTIKDGRYRQGASDIYVSGTYTARKVDDTTWELDILHEGQLAGRKSTLVVRKDGAFVVAWDKERPGGKTRFKRK